MNFRLLLCIAMGVLVIHIGVVMLIAKFRPAPHSTRPKPNFSARATVVVDPKTGEKTTYREITVSTRFAATPAPQPPTPPQIDTASAR